MTFNSVYGILYLINGKWYLLGPEPTEEMLANPDAWAESEFDNSDDNWPVWPTDGSGWKEPAATVPSGGMSPTRTLSRNSSASDPLTGVVDDISTRHDW